MSSDVEHSHLTTHWLLPQARNLQTFMLSAEHNNHCDQLCPHSRAHMHAERAHAPLLGSPAVVERALSCCLHICPVAMQVMLGASAVLSNGTVLSRAGSAAVAMTAHASSKPVLVCCEAFKVWPAAHCPPKGYSMH